MSTRSQNRVRRKVHADAACKRFLLRFILLRKRWRSSFLNVMTSFHRDNYSRHIRRFWKAIILEIQTESNDKNQNYKCNYCFIGNSSHSTFHSPFHSLFVLSRLWTSHSMAHQKSMWRTWEEMKNLVNYHLLFIMLSIWVILLLLLTYYYSTSLILDSWHYQSIDMR